jgi:hypothetical protein
MSAPADRRTLPQRPTIGPLPTWLPSAHAASITLVGVLVLLATIFQTALNPGLSPAPDTPAIQVPVFSTSPFAASPTATQEIGDLASPTAAGTPDSKSVGSDSVPLLPDYRIVAYYGHPNDPNMGILGQYDKEGLLEQLRDEAAALERADPSRPVMPAFEVIGSVAQPDPGPDGSYILQTDETTMRDFITFTQTNNILLIIDIQIGTTSVKDEMALLTNYLLEPNVHLAIDPEFAWGPDGSPSDGFGSIDASDINYAQEELARIAQENNLPPKLLIVHRFTDGMVTNIKQVKEIDGVQFVLDFDGFGDPASKQEGYGLFVRESDVPYGGIKLFYDQDRPLMQPEDVVNLDPPPDFVMYQ